MYIFFFIIHYLEIDFTTWAAPRLKKSYAGNATSVTTDPLHPMKNLSVGDQEIKQVTYLTFNRRYLRPNESDIYECHQEELEYELEYN